MLKKYFINDSEPQRISKNRVYGKKFWIVGHVTILVCAVTIAVFINKKANIDYNSLLESYRTSSYKEAQLASEKAQDKFKRIYENIRTISFLPSVQKIAQQKENIDEDTRKTIQQIYNDLANSVDISEVYIVPADIDPDGPNSTIKNPILMFDELVLASERAKENPEEVANIKNQPEVEIYEYRQLKETMAWLKERYPAISSFKKLNVPFVSGPEIITCDNTDYDRTLKDSDRSGFIMSVPFYGPEGRLKGTISAIMRTNALRAFLPNEDYALTNPSNKFFAMSLHNGQEQKSQQWVSLAKPDPELLFSAVIPINIDGQNSQISQGPRSFHHYLPFLVSFSVNICLD